MLHVRRLCEWDKNIYDIGKGVKTDLQRHHKTRLWPFLLTQADLEQALCEESRIAMNRPERDIALCQTIADFWRKVFLGAPAWESASHLGILDSAVGKRTALQSDCEVGSSKRPRTSKVVQNHSMADNSAKHESRAGATDGSTNHDDSLQKERNALLCMLALVALSPSEGEGYEAWCRVYWALLNSIGDASLALDAFNQWSSGEDSYKGEDDVLKTFGSAGPRTDASFRIENLVVWARRNPALVVRPGGSKDDAEEPTADVLLARHVPIAPRSPVMFWCHLMCLCM